VQFVRRRGFVALALGAGALLVMAAYALDMRAHGDEVVSRVRLAGIDVGGMNEAELARALDRVAARYEEAKVKVKAPQGSFTSPASSLGLRVDRKATTDAVMRVGRGGLPISRLWSWGYSFISPRTASVEVAVDRAQATRLINEKDPGPHNAPVEPSITFEDDAFVAVAGKPGKGIDADNVAAKLSEAAGTGKLISVSVPRDTVQPRFSLVDAKRVAAEADRLVRDPVGLAVGDQETVASLVALRSWATAVATDSRLRFAHDGEKAAEDQHKRLPKVGAPVVETTFAVNGGQVAVTPGQAGTSCCDPAVGPLVERALRGSLAQPVDVPLRRTEPKITAEQASSLGIKEVVGIFTTKHPPGQPRVKNIHRIADLMRGQVILPGQTLSVNAIVGKRTAAKGFVAAPTIQEGLFVEDFGGGVSQFATTLFNAAFLAGLEFPEYQSHSIYLPRYPYGREATLNHPHPDLKIRNTTPYGILIWPSYTGSAVSVTLYSTKTWKVTQTGQTKSPSGVCTRVRTERTRVRISDNVTKKDAVFATYRPEEGVNCNGTRTSTTTSTPAATTSTTKKPGATSTTSKPVVTTAPATTAPPAPTTPTTAAPP
jgi:vancomycin resistance protein YoaR